MPPESNKNKKKNLNILESYKLWTIPISVFFFFFLTLNCRRSHTFRIPSSPPDRRNGSFLFQLMTLTSDEWASLAESIELGGARISQMRIDWSTEQEAKTCGKQKHMSTRFRFFQIKKFQVNRRHCVRVQTLGERKLDKNMSNISN